MASSFGQCLSCFPGLQPDMRMVSGNTMLAEAWARRLITPRGRLITDPNYGYDLGQWLNADMGPSDTAEIAANVQAEGLKDERILSTSAVVTVSNETLLVAASGLSADGPFAFVLSVSQASKLLQISSA